MAKPKAALAAARSSNHRALALALEGRASRQAANQADATGRSVLAEAAMRDDTATMALLLAAGAEVDRPDKKMQRPIHWACRMRAAKAVRLLAERGADVESANDAGLRPIHVAAISESLPTVAAILDAGADPHAPDGHGVSALAGLISRAANAEPSKRAQKEAFAEAFGRLAAQAASRAMEQAALPATLSRKAPSL